MRRRKQPDHQNGRRNGRERGASEREGWPAYTLGYVDDWVRLGVGIARRRSGAGRLHAAWVQQVKQRRPVTERLTMPSRRLDNPAVDRYGHLRSYEALR